MRQNVSFKCSPLPYLLVAPQIIITLVFFIWPAGQALYQSMLVEDAFGLSRKFVWLDNFKVLLSDPAYLHSFGRTFFFSFCVALTSLTLALVLSAMAEHTVRMATTYRTLIIWPYAVAPAVAGSLWLFLFDPTLGVMTDLLRFAGIYWNFRLNGAQAITLVIGAAVWKQISYNFLFFVAGLQAIPRSLIEAAAIDGASRRHAFWTIVFPLLTPTTFFLLVVNTVYALFDTFGIIHAVTGGGPGKATETLVYKVYSDGKGGADLGGSAAQSVILLGIVICLTAIQFRYIERKVTY